MDIGTVAIVAIVALVCLYAIHQRAAFQGSIRTKVGEASLDVKPSNDSADDES